MKKVKNFVSDLLVCSMPLGFVFVMLLHWITVGY